MLALRLTRQQAFGLAAIVALIVAALVYVFLSRQAASKMTTEPGPVSVVVTTADIPELTEIKASDVDVKKISAASAPSNALSTPEQAIGQISQVALAKGQTLTSGDVLPRSSLPGLTFSIPDGMRAVTVALDPISGVAGFVQPGDHVDVLATFEQDDYAITKTILQNIEILAMNEQTVPTPPATGEVTNEAKSQENAPAAEKVTSATVAVMPDQAQELVLAAAKGSINLVLRPRTDMGIVALPSSSQIQLSKGMTATTTTEEMQQPAAPAAQQQPPPPGGAYGPPPQAPTAPPAPAPKPKPTVEVICGTQREVVTTQ